MLLPCKYHLVIVMSLTVDSESRLLEVVENYILESENNCLIHDVTNRSLYFSQQNTISQDVLKSLLYILANKKLYQLNL